MERERSLYIFKVKGQISRSLGLYNEFWHLDPCGQDISRTILFGLFKLGMYTSFEKRKSLFILQDQKSNFKVSGPLSNFWYIDLRGQDIARTMQSPCSKSVCTLHMEKGRSLFIFDRGGSHAGYFYSYPQPLVTLYHITFYFTIWEVLEDFAYLFLPHWEFIFMIYACFNVFFNWWHCCVVRIVPKIIHNPVAIKLLVIGLLTLHICNVRLYLLHMFCMFILLVPCYLFVILKSI